MKRSTTASTILSVGFLVATCATGFTQTTIFNDTFNTGNDTVQSATPEAPTSTYTSYEYWQQGGTPATPTVGSGSLNLVGRTTASSISEVQAQFTATPVTLATVGDYINLSVSFVNTTQVMPYVGGTLNLGMFNSGGSAPVQGTRLDASGEGTGGAVGWLGYVGRISDSNTVTSVIYSRPAQGAGRTSPNQSQDLLFNGASGSATFNNPTGTQVGSAGTVLGAGLTQGDNYTIELQYTLAAAGDLTILETLFDNTSDTQIYTLTQTTSSAALTDTFDAMAFGWRYNSSSASSGVGIDQILVQDDIQTVPEPSILALSGLGGLGLLGLARFRRRN